MPQSPERRNPPRHTPDVIERLYVFWGVSTLLLLLGIIILATFGGGALRQQRRDINQQTETMNRLLERITALETAVSQLASRAPTGTTTRPATGRPTDTRPAPGPSGKPTSAPTSKPASSTQAATPFPDEAAINTLLDDALKNPTAPQSAHVDLLNRVLREGNQVNWTGRTWGRLALLALYQGQEEAAATLARRAETLGMPATDYEELAARRMLEQGRDEDALRLARKLTGAKDAKPAAHLLLVEILLAQQNPAAASEALDKLDNPGTLSKRDQLRLGRAYVALERWNRFHDLIARLGPVPDALGAERDFLRAVWLVQLGGGDDPRKQAEALVEALAILDYLREERPDYLIQVWRGVALMQARQLEAAREAFTKAAEQNPDRPEAPYWRGMLEIRAGQSETGIEFLQNALAASAHFAPAWEALATLDLNHNDIPAALENLAHAVEANPQRASAHFLTAIAQAKAAHREEAIAALKTALKFDAALLPVAQKTDVLSKLFETGEMERLIERPAAATQPHRPAGEG